MTKDTAVREAAKLLGAAIAEAEAAGYRVTWPASAAGLGAIGVSETGRVVQPEPEPEFRQLAELSVDDGPGLLPATVEEMPGLPGKGVQESGSNLPPPITARRTRRVAE